MAFVALEAGSKIDEFSCDFGVIPDPESRVVLGGWRSFFGDSKQSMRPET